MSYRRVRFLLAMCGAAAFGVAGGLIVHLCGWTLGGGLLVLLCALTYIRPCAMALWQARRGDAARYGLYALTMLGAALLLLPFPLGTIEVYTPQFDRIVEPFAVENVTYQELYGQLCERRLATRMYVTSAGNVSFRLSSRASVRDVLKEIERQTGLVAKVGVCANGHSSWSRLRTDQAILAIELYTPDIVSAGKPGPIWVISRLGMFPY